MARIHQLGHERQSCLVACLLEVLERDLAEALERVGRGTRLERTAAEHRDALGRDAARRLERLLAGLDGARPGDEAEVAVADAAVAHLDHGRVGRELAGHELVRLQDREHLLDSGEALERQRGEQLTLADRADHRGLAARRHERGTACLVETGDDVVDLLGRRMPAHHDQAARVHRSQPSFVSVDRAPMQGPDRRAIVQSFSASDRIQERQ